MNTNRRTGGPLPARLHRLTTLGDAQRAAYFRSSAQERLAHWICVAAGHAVALGLCPRCYHEVGG